MSRKVRRNFSGVVMYPKEAPPLVPITVGAWISRSLTAGQIKMVMGVARRCIGKMEVHGQPGATAIVYEVPDIPSRAELVRNVAVFLSALVKESTGQQSILREFKSSDEINRALEFA